MTEPRPWQVLRSAVVLDQPPWLQVIRQSVRLPDNSVIEDYLLTPGRDFSMVLALTADRQALLVRQYKHGAGRAVLEFPAGYLDAPDEDPLACARRELREETGHAAWTWIPLGAFHLDPNRAANRAHFFLARDLERVAEPEPDATEFLSHLRLPLGDIPELLRSGRMSSMACAACWGAAVPYLDS